MENKIIRYLCWGGVLMSFGLVFNHFLRGLFWYPLLVLLFLFVCMVFYVEVYGED